jgi:hypothetical protein
VVLVGDPTTRDVNLVMLGRAAHTLGAPPLRDLEGAAVEVLGKKVDPASIRAALAEGFGCPS